MKGNVKFFNHISLRSPLPKFQNHYSLNEILQREAMGHTHGVQLIVWAEKHINYS
jgi:hypothetical protein